MRPSGRDVAELNAEVSRAFVPVRPKRFVREARDYAKGWRREHAARVWNAGVCLVGLCLAATLAGRYGPKGENVRKSIRPLADFERTTPTGPVAK